MVRDHHSITPPSSPHRDEHEALHAWLALYSVLSFRVMPFDQIDRSDQTASSPSPPILPPHGMDNEDRKPRTAEDMFEEASRYRAWFVENDATAGGGGGHELGEAS